MEVRATVLIRTEINPCVCVSVSREGMRKEVLSTSQTFLGTPMNPYSKSEFTLAESAVFPRQRDIIHHHHHPSRSFPFFLRVKLSYVSVE